MAWYGSGREAPPARAKSFHREAMAALAGIAAVMLVVALVASSQQGGRVGLMAAPVEGLLPYANMEQLAANHHIWVGGHDLNPVHMVHHYRETHPDGWDKTKTASSETAASQASMKWGKGTQSLATASGTRKGLMEREQMVVAKKLAQDMRKLWSDKSPAAKSADLRTVEIMKGRFEALQGAVHSGPVLKQLPSRNDGRVHVEDPRTGKVYTLYEYHTPGGYEDAELEFDPTLANDLKGIAPFKNGIERVPTYQGEHYEYAEGIPIAEVSRKPQTLYEYHVPGGYEDAELEFDPTLANDLKGIAPFKNGIERVPTYQGEPYEYAEGIPIAEKSAAKPQQLSQAYGEPAWAASPWLVYDQPGGKAFTSAEERNPLYQGVAPEYPDFVVADDAGQLRLVRAASVPGTVANLRARRAAAEREWASKAPQVLARRRAQLASMAAKHKQEGPPEGGPKPEPPSGAKAQGGGKATSAKAAMMQQLAALPGRDKQQWGSIYEPSKSAVEGASNDPNPLSGESKDMYKHWHSLAEKYNAVYDPTEDHTLAHNFGGGDHGSNWWANTRKGDDKWWNHDHSARGY